MTLRPRALTAALVAAPLLLLAACGGSSTPSPTSSGDDIRGTKDAALAAKVPPSVSAGGLTIATDPSYAPVEFVDDSGKIVGIDVDLGTAIADVLGLQPHFQKAIFDNIIPALAGGRYDLSMSAFTDTKEREQTVDFVTYFSAGTSFVVAADGPTINTLDDLCGHTVALESGTTQAHDSRQQSGKCVRAGKDPVHVQAFKDQNAANLALNSGRAELTMVDSPVGAYQADQSDGALKVTGQPYNTAPYGIVIPKGSPMVQLVLDAMNQLMADGTYAAILKKWDVSSGAIDKPVINGAIF